MQKRMLTLTLSIAVFVLAEISTLTKLVEAQAASIDKSPTTESARPNGFQAVSCVIYGWLNAWQSRNLSDYTDYYSPQFRSGDLDYQNWRKK